MIKEKELFIKILADHLNERKTIINDDNIDWNTIIQLARKHQISGIIYSQVEDYLPTEYASFMRREMLSIAYLQTNRMKDLEIIKSSFSGESIPFFIIKGNTVADLYPIPVLRTMGDSDIVVHSYDRERCHQVLLHYGFTCISKQEDREWQYLKNNMEYELHDRLVYKEAVNKKGQAEFLNLCWKYVINDELDWSYHLLFLLFHLSKHLMNAGVGFRQFLDIAVVAQKKQIDWEWLKTSLKEIKLWTFALKCFGLIERWYEIRTPISETIDDSFYEVSTEEIFHNGIFGYNDISVAITNEVREKRLPHLKMIHILLREIFPSAKRLKTVERYAYLKKNKIWLPVAWVHRWIWVICNKRAGYKIFNLKKVFVSNEAIRERTKTLNQWGL